MFLTLKKWNSCELNSFIHSANILSKTKKKIRFKGNEDFILSLARDFKLFLIFQCKNMRDL